ncbi:hypothetical protein F5146DRAFT_997316 [Armillaria mellea]|nr:hypothetical protein F5146DRAFT_997316 [Armillaria mellea]
MGFLWVPVIALGLYFATRSFGRAFRRRVLQEQTCLLDADNLSVRLAAGKIKGTAIICGGSAPSQRNQESRRSRVIQYNSLHSNIYPAVLLAIGYIVLCKLFPNLDEECKASGLGLNESRTFVSGNRIQAPTAEYGGSLPKTTYAGRAGLETLIRRLVLGGNYKNIRQITGTVTGVLEMESTLNSLNQLYGPGNSRHKMAGTGRLHYSTLQFCVPPELGRRLPGLPVPYDECGVIYCLFTDSAKDHRVMYSQRVDGDFLQVAFLAWRECELPTTLEEVKACARSLVTQKPIPQTFFDMLDALKEVEDTVTCSRLAFPGSSYIRYEKAVNLPSNWVALGDSVMRVNPVYGQGCTKAFFGALCLNTLLRELDRDSPRLFQEVLWHACSQDRTTLVTRHATKTGDYAYPTTVPVAGETLAKGSWIRWYMKKLYAVALNSLIETTGCPSRISPLAFQSTSCPLD